MSDDPAGPLQSGFSSVGVRALKGQAVSSMEFASYLYERQEDEAGVSRAEEVLEFWQGQL